MQLRDDYNSYSDAILKKMLLTNYFRWKKRLLEEKKEKSEKDLEETRELEVKLAKNKLDLYHLQRDRLNVKK